MKSEEPVSKKRDGPKRPNIEAHTWNEVDRTTIFDLDEISVAVIDERCQDCEAEMRRSGLVGNPPRTEQEIKNIIYQIYASLYEDPRSIGYATLMALAPDEVKDDNHVIPFTDLFFNAVNLGCQDAQNGRDKRTRSDVFNHILE